MSVGEDSGPSVHMMGTTQWSHCPPTSVHRTGTSVQLGGRRQGQWVPQCSIYVESGTGCTTQGSEKPSWWSHGVGSGYRG